MAGGSSRTVSRTTYAFTGASGRDIPSWKRPDVFVNAGIAGASIPDPSDQFVLSQVEPDANVPRYLNQIVVDDVFSENAVSKSNVSTEFNPVASLNPVFHKHVTAETMVKIRMSDGLMDAGLTLPGLKLDQGSDLKAWQIILSVNIAKDGNVSDVFIEQSTGNQKLDESLACQIYNAKAGNPSGQITGTISINKGQ